MSGPERTEAEMAERIAAFEAAPAAPESWPSSREAQDVMSYVCDTFVARGDSEAGHSYEDEAHGLALAYIREGRGDAAELARIALMTDDIKFDRWYA